MNPVIPTKDWSHPAQVAALVIRRTPGSSIDLAGKSSNGDIWIPAFAGMTIGFLQELMAPAS